jgi:hypothetical protein
LLHLGSVTFSGDPPLDRAARRTGRAPDTRGRREGFPNDGAKAVRGSVPIAALGTVLGGGDGQHTAGQPGPQ